MEPPPDEGLLPGYPPGPDYSIRWETGQWIDDEQGSVLMRSSPERNRPRYSPRNAISGSTRVARRAGTAQATIATAINRAATAAKVSGSVGCTP